MKILQINASYKPAYLYGGPTMSVSTLSEQLVKAGEHVEVYTTTANGDTELQVSTSSPTIVNGVTVRYHSRVTKDHSHFSPALLFKLWRSVKNFDVVHIHAWWNLVSVLSCLVAVVRNVPVIVSPRGTLSAYSFGHKNPAFKRIFHQLLSKPLLRRCHIHTTSQKEQNAVARLIESKSVTTIFNFVRLSPEQAAQPQQEDDVLRLIFLSRIDEKKGLELLLKALTLVKVPFKLTIAGDGDEGYVNGLKQFITRHGLADHIIWAGFISEDKFQILAAHHLMVLPSYDENFGNVVIESLSAGTAVLISEHVGLVPYVTEIGGGWICTLEPKNIALRITEAAQSREKIAQIRRLMPGLINHDFEPQQLVKKYIDLYKAVTKAV